MRFETEIVNKVVENIQLYPIATFSVINKHGKKSGCHWDTKYVSVFNIKLVRNNNNDLLSGIF